MPIQMLHNPETGNGLLLQPPVGFSEKVREPVGFGV